MKNEALAIASSTSTCAVHVNIVYVYFHIRAHVRAYAYAVQTLQPSGSRDPLMGPRTASDSRPTLTLAVAPATAPQNRPQEANVQGGVDPKKTPVAAAAGQMPPPVTDVVRKLKYTCEGLEEFCNSADIRSVIELEIHGLNLPLPQIMLQGPAQFLLAGAPRAVDYLLEFGALEIPLPGGEFRTFIPEIADAFGRTEAETYSASERQEKYFKVKKERERTFFAVLPADMLGRIPSPTAPLFVTCETAIKNRIAEIAQEAGIAIDRFDAQPVYDSRGNIEHKMTVYVTFKLSSFSREKDSMMKYQYFKLVRVRSNSHIRMSMAQRDLRGLGRRTCCFALSTDPDHPETARGGCKRALTPLPPPGKKEPDPEAGERAAKRKAQADDVHERQMNRMSQQQCKFELEGKMCFHMFEGSGLCQRMHLSDDQKAEVDCQSVRSPGLCQHWHRGLRCPFKGCTMAEITDY